MAYGQQSSQGGGDISAAGNNAFTGVNTFAGTFSPTLTAMGATAVDVTKAVNTYSATGDATLTYSATPASGTRTLLRITADASDRTITIPSTYSLVRGANITTLLVPAGTTLEVMLQYVTSPSARWEIIGDPAPTLPIASGGTGATTAAAAYDAISGPETSVASATTTDLGAVASNKVSVTGTTTITGFGTVAAGVQKWVRFAGALTLTHNGTSLILPTSANIVTVAGDTLHCYSLGSGNWRVIGYSRADGTPLMPDGIGYMPVVFAQGVTPASTNGSGTTLAINGGTVAIPISVHGKARVDTLWLSNRDSSGAHTLEARLYYDDGSGNLQFVTGTDCSFSYTPVGNSNLSAQVSVPGTLLRPGLYWLLVRNTSASVTAAMGGIGANLTNGHYYATKTLGSALGATVDFSTGWTGAGSVFMSAYYTGRVAGLSSAF